MYNDTCTLEKSSECKLSNLIATVNLKHEWCTNVQQKPCLSPYMQIKDQNDRQRKIVIL